MKNILRIGFTFVDERLLFSAFSLSVIIFIKFVKLNVLVTKRLPLIVACNDTIDEIKIDLTLRYAKISE